MEAKSVRFNYCPKKKICFNELVYRSHQDQRKNHSKFDIAQILSCCHISTARYAPFDSKMTSKTSNSTSGSKDIPGNLYPASTI